MISSNSFAKTSFVKVSAFTTINKRKSTNIFTAVPFSTVNKSAWSGDNVSGDAYGANEIDGAAYGIAEYGGIAHFMLRTRVDVTH